jgi:hypothetical protein
MYATINPVDLFMYATINPVALSLTGHS